jgi:predicted acyltransferase
MDNTKRLVALDVFRGLTVALMIVVNNPGNWSFVYPPLKHSAWNGCTPTDLVFPFFMFIVGAAMWYSYKKYNNTLTGKLVWKILRRTLLIYLIGLLLTAYSRFSFDLTNIRIMGVLPRIALGYGIASFIVLGMRLSLVKILTAIILLGYWAILVIFGGDSPFSLEGNFVRTFDIAVLGINHIPQFHGVKFDQTGLLATLPSIANVLLGYFAGRLIDISEIKLNAVKKLILYGIAGIGAAKGWDLFLPINKPLWTSSFVLYTSGFASLLLGMLLWIIDIKGFTKWTKPFLIFGMNPLFIYVFSEFLAISSMIKVAQSQKGESFYLASWIYDSCFLPLAGAFNGSLLYALTFTMICWLIGWFLFYKKIFIKL